MARIRSIKPSLRTSRVVASWPREVRYAWTLLWGYLDDSGRGLDIPKGIAGDCFPYDDDITPSKMDKWLKLMATPVAPKKTAPLCRYQVGGVRYLHSVNWGEHCKPNRPTPSILPPCPIHESLTESLTEPSSEPDTDPVSEAPLSPHVLELETRNLKLGTRNGEVETASAEPVTEPPAADPAMPEPPAQCPKHLGNPDPPPCRPCGNARKANTAWYAARIAQRMADTAGQRQKTAHDRAETNRLAIAACHQCDGDGYHGGLPCTHDPNAADRTRRGAAAASAAITRKGTAA